VENQLGGCFYIFADDLSFRKIFHATGLSFCTIKDLWF